MRTLLAILSLAFIMNQLSGQEDTLRLSLNQALDLGLRNRYDIQASTISIDIAETNLTKQKKDLLPEIAGGGRLSYHGQVQPSIIPAGYLGFTEPQKITIGMKNNTVFTLDLSLNLFKPGMLTDINIARNGVKQEQEKDLQLRSGIRNEISEAYFNVLLKQIQYEIAVKNKARYEEYMILARGKYDEGVLLESDMMLAELNFNNARANTDITEQNLQTSRLCLCNRINVPEESVLILTDSLRVYESVDFTPESPGDLCAEQPEIRRIKIEQDRNSLLLKKALQNYLPTATLFANYTELFQGNGLDYSDSFFWSPVNYVGIRLSVPITGSFKNSSSVRECRLKISQTDLVLEQKISDVNYQLQMAALKLSNAIQNVSVAYDNYLYSQKVYEMKKRLYDTGSFSYEKLLDTEKSLSTAEQSYLTTIYELLIARINYERTLGK